MTSFVSTFPVSLVDAAQSILCRHYIHILRVNEFLVPDKSCKNVQFNDDYAVFAGADDTVSEKQGHDDISSEEPGGKRPSRLGMFFDSMSVIGRHLQLCAAVSFTNPFKANALKKPDKDGSVSRVGCLNAICVYPCRSETEKLRTPQINFGPKWVSFLHST